MRPRILEAERSPNLAIVPTYLGRCFKYFDVSPVVKLTSWLRSIFYSTTAGSRKSKVWVANLTRKKLRHGTNRWPVRPHTHCSFKPQNTDSHGMHVTTRGLTVRVPFQGYLFMTSHSARRVPSHVACQTVRGSPEVHHRLYMRVRYINLTLAAVRPPQFSLHFSISGSTLPCFALLAQTFASTQEPPSLLSRPRRMADCFSTGHCAPCPSPIPPH